MKLLNVATALPSVTEREPRQLLLQPPQKNGVLESPLGFFFGAAQTAREPALHSLILLPLLLFLQRRRSLHTTSVFCFHPLHWLQHALLWRTTAAVAALLIFLYCEVSAVSSFQRISFSTPLIWGVTLVYCEQLCTSCAEVVFDFPRNFSISFLFARLLSLSSGPLPESLLLLAMDRVSLF